MKQNYFTTFGKTVKTIINTLLHLKGITIVTIGHNYQLNTNQCLFTLKVVHPDHLLSGTSIVSSLFCTRKAVLAERFKGLEGDWKFVLEWLILLL